MKKVVIPQRNLELAWDEAGTGNPIVFIHAFPFDQEMWLPQMRGLSNDYRVITFDLPGFGSSSAPAEEYTVEALADVTADFLDAIGLLGSVVIAGLSMGGYVALAFARRHPERLRGLILADTKAEPDDEAARANRDTMAEIARREGAAGVIERLIPKLISEETAVKRPHVSEQVRRIGTRQKVPTIVLALQALRDRPDATSGLAQITVPTLILVGEHDSITPPKGAFSLSERILGSTVVTIPGVGHLSNLEGAEAFNEQIRRFVHHPDSKF